MTAKDGIATGNINTNRNIRLSSLESNTCCDFSTSEADGLDPWIEAALASPVASFARGVVADRAAVAAAIALKWSNGQTEGNICRLKTLKRQMGGRANLDLLKGRLMPAA